MANAASGDSQRGSHETNVSTSQPQTQKDSRLSCTDGDSRRPRRSQTAPGKGAEASHGDHSAQATEPASRVKASPFPKALRLRRREDFLRVQAQGQRRVRGAFVVLVLRRQDGGPSRLGVTASRKVGRAVVRNRVKRLVREFFRQYASSIQPPVDVVVIARPQAAKLKFDEVKRDLASALGIRC